MISRFEKIYSELEKIVELLELLPTHPEKAILVKALHCLTKFNQITVMLQRDGITFVEVRRIMDAVLADYPEFAHHLSETASIVENPVFEKAVMRIASSLPLTEEQRCAATCLLLEKNNHGGAEIAAYNAGASSSDDDDEATNNALKVQRRLKRQKRVSNTAGDNYINLDLLPGTSVNCERLFSLAKHILSDTRKKTSPRLFEALLFLKVNREMWDVYDVGVAMGRSASGLVVAAELLEAGEDDEVLVDLEYDIDGRLDQLDNC